ncbi:hypothetical protein F5Y02DRAFT_368774 [Annulohypoxylon stygium]|nr:hypothetical protein F5Y02DRAFT_368774 [Annulohypoxylon stygium]
MILCNQLAHAFFLFSDPSLAIYVKRLGRSKNRSFRHIFLRCRSLNSSLARFFSFVAVANRIHTEVTEAAKFLNFVKFVFGIA